MFGNIVVLTVSFFKEFIRSGAEVDGRSNCDDFTPLCVCLYEETP